MIGWHNSRAWTISSLLAVMLLAGCAGRDRPAALANLPDPTLPSAEQIMTQEDPERIARRYERALAVAESPALRWKIRRRLADLAMARSETEQAESDSIDALFDEPIRRYTELIDDYRAERFPDVEAEPDRLYYQLAKAYALDGRMGEADTTLAALAEQFPESRYYDEAQFRRAERAFSEGDYDRAEALYAVLAPEARVADNAFGQNALYMRAWARFKRADYADALISFSGVLDHLVGTEGTPAEVEQRWPTSGDARTEVADDALRAMALALTHLDGPESIVALERDIGPRPYDYRLYRRLAETYRDQERYRDSARSYAEFVHRHPDSDLAPDFSVREIQTYVEGRYPSLVWPAKQAFVRRYGLLSRYWFERGGRPGEQVLTHLNDYLRELANEQHAYAQRLASQSDTDDSARRQAFTHAATWYREFVATFPEDPEAGPMQFLLAETLNEAGQWPEALDTYEAVAFDRQDPEHGREAGYAAVLLAGRLDEQAGGTSDAWWRRRVDLGQRFANQYPDDPRATSVLLNLAQGEFEQGELTSAVELANTLLDWQPPATERQQFSAWLVLGHAHFDQGAYAQAEEAYWELLERWPSTAEAMPAENAPTRSEVRERIAASIYQRARQLLDEEQTLAAVALLQRVPDELPDTTVAAQAQFDVAHYLMAAEQWPEAERALRRFRADYPAHPLAAQLPARLAKVYRAQENWSAAAAELRRLEQISDDPALQAESLFLAAELYQRAGDRGEAIDAYRRYAHTYPEPAADRREAEYQLTELYRETGEADKRAFWLERLVDGYQPGASGRATYLAAFGESELAERSYRAFSDIQLRLPLKPSLDRKRRALEKALADQEAVLDYGVAEFATRASHRMAAIYHQLSRDLMESERPEGLGVLELEQYDILLEEQAYPFEEKAIELYQVNTRRSWRGLYDEWVQESFESLSELLPARFGKEERVSEVSRDIY